MNCKNPSAIMLTISSDAELKRRRGRRTLRIGLPLLQTLTVSQLEAAVVFALARRHQMLLDLVDVTYGSVTRSADFVEMVCCAAVAWPYASYGRMLRRIIKPAFEAEQAAAENRAASISGSDVLIEARRTSIRLSVAAPVYFQNNIEEAAAAGFLLPVTAGFAAALSSAETIRLMDETWDKGGREFRAHLADLEVLPRSAARDERPALSLVRNLPAIESRL